MPDLEQERLQVEAAQRDPVCFSALYEDNFYRVYAYVTRRVRDRSTAEDLTSEVFRQALAGISKFEWQGAPFIAWLLRIASRSVADHFSQQGREAVPILLPEASSADSERTAALFQLVDRLPEIQYQVIHLRFVEQKSIREIAQVLDRTEGAIKQLQFRAMETLRAQWEGGDA